MNAQDAHEAMEEIRESGARRVALLVAVLAALLAIVEMSGGNAEQDALKHNIDAANIWSFFQAKTIRQSIMVRTVELLELQLDVLPPERREPIDAQLAEWRATVARYETEPETGEGRRELVARARAAEAARDEAMAAANMFDFGSAAFQLAIVLASASVVVGVGWLAVGAGLLGMVGTGLAVMGWFGPLFLAF